MAVKAEAESSTVDIGSRIQKKHKLQRKIRREPTLLSSEIKTNLRLIIFHAVKICLNKALKQWSDIIVNLHIKKSSKLRLERRPLPKLQGQILDVS